MRSGRAPPGNSTVLRGKMGISATSAAWCRVSFQPVDELLVESTEAAIAHDQYMVATLHFGHHRVGERAQVMDHAGTVAQATESAGHIPFHVGPLMDKHPVRLLQ